MYIQLAFASAPEIRESQCCSGQAVDLPSRVVRTSDPGQNQSLGSRGASSDTPAITLRHTVEP
jgi:hypothetical protein